MIKKNCELTDIAKILKGAKSVAITPHKNTDGDCFASMFALNLALKKIGIDSNVCADENLPDFLNFLNGFINFEILAEIPETDIIVVVDVSYLERASFKNELLGLHKKGKKIIVLDHHPGGNPEDFSDFHYIDTSAASSSEIIYKLIETLGILFDKNIATCLMTGIESDTTGFSNLNTTAKTFKIAADLTLKGARLSKINSAFKEMTLERLQLLGRVMDRLIYNPKLKTAASYITFKDMEGLGLGSDSTSGVANTLNTIKEVSVLFLLSEEKPGEIKISMRTRDENINLSEFAKKLGGGGHPGASGFTIKGSILVENNRVEIV